LKINQHAPTKLLNISLPFDSTSLNINNAPLLTPSTVLPRIYASQVLLDTASSTLSELVENNSLDNPGSGFFGLSYAYSLRKLQGSQALVFHFDVLEVWTDLLEPAMTFKLSDEKQKMLELVLLQRPLLSPGDVSRAYEIVRVELVQRPKVGGKRKVKTMWFQEWDVHGQKGTPGHLVAKASDASMTWITSGVWSLVLFILAVIGLFVVLCLFCIFGFGGFGGDEYERAQHGKKRGMGTDAEKGKGRFLSAEELGLRSGAKIVGVGKSD
jgi:hypothetical protein